MNNMPLKWFRNMAKATGSYFPYKKHYNPEPQAPKLLTKTAGAYIKSQL